MFFVEKIIRHDSKHGHQAGELQSSIGVLFQKLLATLNEIVRISFGCRLRGTSAGINGGETLGVIGRAGLGDRGGAAGKETALRPGLFDALSKATAANRRSIP